MDSTESHKNQAMLGAIGILGACAVWLASILALVFAMHHIIRVSAPPQIHPARANASGSDLPMVLGCTAFTLLQLTSFLLFAFVLRGSWRLRSAVCFSLAAGLVMVGDAAGLLALLVWLGVTLGAA